VTAATVAAAAVSADDVCAAVETLLRAQLPDALAARNAARDLELRDPVSWGQVPAPTLLVDKQTPCIEISSPGFPEPPEMMRGGRYQASWSVIVTVYLRGSGFAETARDTREYTQVIAAVLVWDAAQEQPLGGLAWSGVLRDEDYDAVALKDSRTLGGGAVEFIYTIDRALDPDAT